MKVSTPPSTAAFHERSGSPREPWSRLEEIPDWKLGVEKSTLRPPPVAAGSQSSFHTASVVTALGLRAHAMWFDELQAWNIARASHSLGDLECVKYLVSDVYRFFHTFQARSPFSPSFMAVVGAL